MEYSSSKGVDHEDQSLRRLRHESIPASAVICGRNVHGGDFRLKYRKRYADRTVRTSLRS